MKQFMEKVSLKILHIEYQIKQNSLSNLFFTFFVMFLC